MLGPISAIEVARTSIKVSDPALHGRNFAFRWWYRPRIDGSIPSSDSAAMDGRRRGALVAAGTALPCPLPRAISFRTRPGCSRLRRSRSLTTRISNFNAQTGKEIVVVTTPSLGGATLQSAAQAAFSQQNVNGVLIFIARDDRRDIIVPDRAGSQAGWFTPDVLRSIRTSMEASSKARTTTPASPAAVDAILNIYRAHLGGLQRSGSGAALPAVRRAGDGRDSYLHVLVDHHRHHRLS